jgi:large conductance mechanosensitive channel
VLKEFKEFAMKGSMLDMAVGIIIGAAFATVISSLVADVLMPPIGLALGGVDFANFFAVLSEGSPAGPYATVEAAQEAGAVTLNWGMFVNNIITFAIVAFSVFLVIRNVNRAKKKEEEAPAEPPAHEVLLGEIRDLLKTRS